MYLYYYIFLFNVHLMYIVQVAIRDSTKHHTHTHALYTVGLVRACVLTYLPTVRSKPCLPQAP